ncbi:hypothetical protein [Micromonospora sp. WMMD737]|uniref:hypothetical protein n=1 Tax=Micromonospora sp. WMMD737 TaxID=3404113 RepID=UPI003B965218
MPSCARSGRTANVLQVKSASAFALELPTGPDSEAAVLHEGIDRHRITVLKRAQDNKLIDEAADLDRVRRVYYAPLGESLRSNADDAGPDALAAPIIGALLQGAGPRP